jgi:hypothetical protein
MSPHIVLGFKLGSINTFSVFLLTAIAKIAIDTNQPSGKSIVALATNDDKKESASCQSGDQSFGLFARDRPRSYEKGRLVMNHCP